MNWLNFLNTSSSILGSGQFSMVVRFNVQRLYWPILKHDSILWIDYLSRRSLICHLFCENLRPYIGTCLPSPAAAESKSTFHLPGVNKSLTLFFLSSGAIQSITYSFHSSPSLQDIRLAFVLDWLIGLRICKLGTLMVTGYLTRVIRSEINSTSPLVLALQFLHLIVKFVSMKLRLSLL